MSKEKSKLSKVIKWFQELYDYPYSYSEKDNKISIEFDNCDINERFRATEIWCTDDIPVQVDTYDEDENLIMSKQFKKQQDIIDYLIKEDLVFLLNEEREKLGLDVKII